MQLPGRWTRVDFNGGFALLETDDNAALADFAMMWSDLMVLTIVPVLNDDEWTGVFERTGKTELRAVATAISAASPPACDRDPYCILGGAGHWT